jgi:hypothetical protein
VPWHHDIAGRSVEAPATILDRGPQKAVNEHRTLHSMPTPRRLNLGEALITTTLFSIYVGTTGTARAISMVQRAV